MKNYKLHQLYVDSSNHIYLYWFFINQKGDKVAIRSNSISYNCEYWVPTYDFKQPLKKDERSGFYDSLINYVLALADVNHADFCVNFPSKLKRKIISEFWND